jgi:hypothetical protein
MVDAYPDSGSANASASTDVFKGKSLLSRYLQPVSPAEAGMLAERLEPVCLPFAETSSETATQVPRIWL